jgi:hypothetical protein
MQLGVIIFCSVRFLLKKVTKLVFFKNQNWFKPTGFGYFRTKTSSGLV